MIDITALLPHLQTFAGSALAAWGLSNVLGGLLRQSTGHWLSGIVLAAAGVTVVLGARAA